MADISSLIEQIRARLEGVTSGPWHAVQMATNKPDIDRPFVVGPSEVVVGTDGICEPARYNDRSFPEDAANMRYIALLDPDNIRRLLEYIAELEARTEWRDIESAPRNGQRFLAHIEGVDRAVMIYWNGGEWSTVDGNDWTGRPLLAWLPLPLPSAPGGRDNG